MIPEVALGEVATIVMGQSPPGETYNTTGDGLPFFQGKAEFGKESPTTVKWCSAPQRVAEPGDVLLSVRAPVGPTNFAIERCCIGRGLAAIRGVEGKADTRFLRYFLRKFEVSLASKGVGSTFTAINRSDIERIRIPLPPLPEQKRIVRILDEAEELRRLRAEADRRTADLIPAIFHDMFGDPATNPKGWLRLRVGDVAWVRGGKRLPKGIPYSAEPTSHRYIRGTDILPNQVLSDQLVFIDDTTQRTISRYIVNSGDVIVTIAGKIGVAAPVSSELDGANLTENAAKLVPKEDHSFDPMFLSVSFNSPFVQEQVGGLTGRVTIGKLALFRIEKIEILLPPIEYQRTFSARVAEVRAMEAEQAQSRRRLDDLFQSLLHGFFAEGN